ncbi:MAG: hypothetical protein ACXW2P_09595 [Thermoanaerobaculia bacterium]
MTDAAVDFTEDRVPCDGIEETIAELVELYGGEITRSAPNEREIVLPLRRGVAASGGIQCTLTWKRDSEAEGTVRMLCDRDVDAPKAQRVALLIAGVVGSLLFMIWPFVEMRRGFGALAWVGGAVAIAVYLLTLRRTSGGIAWDFLQRLARRQRGL